MMFNKKLKYYMSNILNVIKFLTLETQMCLYLKELRFYIMKRRKYINISHKCLPECISAKHLQSSG